MEDQTFRIRYEGGDADSHVIDMRLLGESLIGLDRIVSDGLIILTQNRSQKKGERSPVILKAREPKSGSLDIIGDLGEAYGILQFGIPIVQHIGGSFLLQWFKAVISYNSGRKDVAEVCMEVMVQINQDHLSARDRSDQRVHDERMAMLSLFREALPKLASPAAMVASPVGPSVESLGFSAGSEPPVIVDHATAEALRDNGEIEWSEPQEAVLKTDGFTFHTGKLSVEHPAGTGYLLAEVIDPVFSQDGNPYAIAASEKQTVRVLAKIGYRGEKLEKIAILNFIGVVAA